MHPPLQSSFQHLEKQREEFSAWVQKAPAERQHRQPAPDQWSAAQVLFHLSKVDEQVILSLEKRLANGKPLKSLRVSTRLRSFLLNLFLKLPLKFKAPAAVKDVPEKVLVAEVIRQWKDVRERLKDILSKYPAHQLDKEVFFHPRSGMLTITQTLKFMVEHTEHHRRQMRRLLS